MQFKQVLSVLCLCVPVCDGGDDRMYGPGENPRHEGRLHGPNRN